MPLRPCLPRATVVGLSGKQTALLRRHVGDEALLRILTPDRALKFRGDDSDLVIIIRWAQTRAPSAASRHMPRHIPSRGCRGRRLEDVANPAQCGRNRGLGG